MEIFIKGILVLLVVICFVTDVRNNKIYNVVLLPFVIGGLLLNFIFGGLGRGVDSLIGGIIPIIVFAPLFIFKMFGAGDIKLFSTIGFLMGWQFLLNNIIYSFIAGGIVSIILILIRKNFLKRIKYLFSFLFNLILSKSMVDYEKGNGRFPFAVAILLGTVSQLIIVYKFI
ncbi:A24 family peptidase [Clostridium cibarium]|uniref:Prepilin peptidase n=1 Tax=Clostridium cibarium TaxID=2762247 RepID=A0ABR8PPL1_9CLOT|nr:prepilin peptidase [Clostridium cibarium]MBD7910124.1 prepilin peptidase [Clostridium cibarium]